MLQVFSPIGYTGYGYASLNIIKSLIQIDSEIALYPIGQPHIENANDASVIKQCIENAITLPYNAPCLKIWHQFDLLSRYGSGKYLAFPFFEVDKLPKKDVYNLNFPDDIVVSSDWAKNILIDNQVIRPIHIVPLGVDTGVFQPPPDNKKNNKYIFCTIGKWEKRKAHDTIISCFNKAFERTDDVELWLVTHNGFLNAEQEGAWLNLVNSSKLRDKIRVFPRLPTHEKVAELIAHTDCGIYISRGEGWNMELLETMAMNKPVIVSNYSAHQEYCNNDNSFLVNISEKEPAIDNQWFFGDANWAKIGNEQIDQVVDYMRYVYQHQICTNPEGLNTAKKYSWTNTANLLHQIYGQ